MSIPADFKYFKVVNLQQHKGVVIEDGKGIPRFTMGPLRSQTRDFKDVQLNSGFIDQALILLRQGDIQVFLDDIELTADELADLKYIEAMPVGGDLPLEYIGPSITVVVPEYRQYITFHHVTNDGTMLVSGHGVTFS